MASCNRALGLVVLVLMLAMVASSGRAAGQESFAFATGAEETLLLTDSEKAGFNRIFETTAGQHKAVDDLVAAATAHLREQEKKADDATAKAVKEFRSLPEDQRRSADARKALNDKLAAVGPDITALRKDLLNDLRALLSEDQQASWMKFEYFLRREKNRTYHGGWYRDHTNVLALVDALGLTKEQRAPLIDVLESYEHDLDRALIELDGAEAELNKVMAKAREDAEGDRDLLGQNYEAARESSGKPRADAAHKLANLNWQYVRRLSAVLTEAQAQELQKLWEKVALREALGPQQADLGLRAAPDLPGLSEEAHAKITKLVDDYVRDYEPVCRKIAIMEKSLLLGDDSADMTQWDPTRMERGRLLSKTQESLRAELTQAQFEAVLREGSKRVNEWDSKMSR
jgi:hypothetical protein